MGRSFQTYSHCSFSLLGPKKTNQKKRRPVPWSFGLPCASRLGPGAQKLALLRQFARLIGPFLRCSPAGQWVWGGGGCEAARSTGVNNTESGRRGAGQRLTLKSRVRLEAKRTNLIHIFEMP